VLERAAASIGTPPAQRAAKKALVARALRAYVDLQRRAPRELEALVREGHLSRDPLAAISKITKAYPAVEGRQRQAQAARAQGNREVLDAARELLRHPGGAQELDAIDREHPGTVDQIWGLAWRDFAADPKRIGELVAQRGEAGALEFFKANGVARLVPAAVDVYLGSKADDWARKHQDLEWDNGKTLSDLSLAKRLRDPAFQKTAAKALLMNGLNWEGHQSPGHAVLKGLALIAEKGGEKTRLGEARLSEDEVAARVAELSRGTLGSTEDVRGLLRDVSSETDKVRFAKRLADRDTEAAKHRGKIEPSESEKREAATGANRRKILADAMEKAEKPVHGYDVSTGLPVETKGAERMTAHSTRKAALIDGYRKQSGRDVVVDVPRATEPDVYKRRANHREFMSRAFDETVGRPAEPPTGPTEGRAAGLGAAFDRTQSASTSGQEGATDV
jgi:hypothetical protein